MPQFPFQPSTFSFNAMTPALVRQRLGEGADFHLQNGLRVAIAIRDSAQKRQWREAVC